MDERNGSCAFSRDLQCNAYGLNSKQKVIFIWTRRKKEGETLLTYLKMKASHSCLFVCSIKAALTERLTKNLMNNVYKTFLSLDKANIPTLYYHQQSFL